MFKPSDIVIDAYLDRLGDEFRRAHPEASSAAQTTLRRCGRLALTHTARTNALYTNIDGCLLTAEVALRIIEGRQIERFDVSADDWLHFMVAALCVFTGFARGVVPGDRGRDLVVGADGQRFELGRGRTDGCLYPVYIERSQLFARHYFRTDPLIEAERIADYLDYMRFPVPKEDVADRDTLGALLGSAQLVGHAADPRFHQRLKRFYRQLEEAGLAEVMGYRNAQDVLDTYPQRFWKHILPQIEVALSYLKYTGEGQIWLARMNAHMLAEEHRD